MIPFILIAVTTGVVGQLLIKRGLNSLGYLDFSINFISSYLKIFFSPYVFLGCIIYFLAMCFWLYALSKVDLSFAYPFVALSYVLILVVSWGFLGESISLIRWSGVLIICFGVLLVSRS
ncbi:MAG: EamA family transporter [Candidatus Hodarchaeota archaeon]